jgi:ribosomal-protein-alanine N-acetyltransferase
MSSDRPAVSLAPLALDDVAALTDINVRNRVDIDRVSPSDAEADTADAMRRRVERLLADHERGERVSWTIRVDGVIAGDISLSHIQRGALQRANLGYMVDSVFRGRGVATSAARLASARAFEEVGLHRLEAGTMPSNVASQRVLEKAGFTRVGLQRSFLLIAGRWEDHILYELVGPDAPPAAG